MVYVDRNIRKTGGHATQYRVQNAERSDGDDGDVEVEGHSPSADLLASSYALQLEQLGMLQEAAFVLLHIEGSSGCVFA